MKTGEGLSASQEDYLETISALVRESGVARVRDIAVRLSVANPSVTAALRALNKRGLIQYEPYAWVKLTALGEEVAGGIHGRHETIRSFLVDVLDVGARLADESACRMEHVMGEGLMRKLRCFMDFMASSRVTANRLPTAFREHCGKRQRTGKCPRDCRDVSARKPEGGRP